MPDDAQRLDERRNNLLAEFIFDEKRYLNLARFSYFTAQGLLWSSLAASSLAALLCRVHPSDPVWTNVRTPTGAGLSDRPNQGKLRVAPSLSR